MKYIVHKDNVAFWVNACDKGFHIALEKLNNDIQYYDRLINIKTYLQTAEDIELDIQTQQYLLECSESFEEYVLSYDKNKDKVIP